MSPIPARAVSSSSGPACALERGPAGERPGWRSARHLLVPCLALVGVLPGLVWASLSRTPPELYQSYCASCHGDRRLGGLGPPLLPKDLERLSRARTADAIANGLPETHMPGFSDRLSPTQIDALVTFIYHAPGTNTDEPVSARDQAGHGYP